MEPATATKLAIGPRELAICSLGTGKEEGLICVVRGFYPFIVHRPEDTPYSLINITDAAQKASLFIWSNKEHPKQGATQTLLDLAVSAARSYNTCEKDDAMKQYNFQLAALIGEHITLKVNGARQHGVLEAYELAFDIFELMIEGLTKCVYFTVEDSVSIKAWTEEDDS